MFVLDTHVVVWWATKIRATPRVDALPLASEIALLADSLQVHADPADRFIVASAIHHHVPLVAKDKVLGTLRIVETLW